MTRPGFAGCLNCLWLPTCATSYQPSCFKRCMTSRLDIRHDTHFLHTRQVGVCAEGNWFKLSDLNGLVDIQEPALAYLLRVDPVAARSRIEAGMAARGEGYSACNHSLLAQVGTLHLDLFLEEIALAA